VIVAEAAGMDPASRGKGHSAGKKEAAAEHHG